MSNINPWTLLILGILVGWLISWLLELWFFRRRRLECQRNNSRLEAQLRARNAELGAANSQISALRGELGTRAKEIDVLLYQMATQEDAVSFETLVDAPKPFVMEPEAGLAAETHVEPANELASEADAENRGIENQPQIPFDSAEITPDQWSVLRAAGITTEEDLADVNPADLERLFQVPEWQHAEDEIWEPALPPTEIDQPDNSDDMTQIAGIGPKYAAVLQEHGFDTFAELGGSDPDILAKIFEGAGGRAPNFTSWIKQAQTFQAGN